MKRHFFNSSKRTITTAIASVTMATIMMGGTAFADPDNPETQTTETEAQIITETDVTSESVIKLAPSDESLTVTEDTVDLLAPSEGEPTEDRIIIREKTEVMTETTEVSEDSESMDVTDEMVTDEDTTLIIEDETEVILETETPEPELTQASVETASYACHVQPTGDTECICKDDASCEALTNSDSCQPYTEWRDSDLGGCTKKDG